MKKMSHIDDQGRAHMVDISGKKETERRAIATALVLISSELLTQIKANTLIKGDALATARIAGIQAAKRTHELIPLCHPLPITQVTIELETEEKPPAIAITSEVKTHYTTGVEMEALTAAAVAALTIYDMGKSVDKGIVIERIRLEEKDGGKSGAWRRPKKK